MSYVTHSYKIGNVYLRVPSEHLYGRREEDVMKHMEDIRSNETFKMEGILFKALGMLPIVTSNVTKF